MSCHDYLGRQSKYIIVIKMTRTGRAVCVPGGGPGHDEPSGGWELLGVKCIKLLGWHINGKW